MERIVFTREISIQALQLLTNFFTQRTAAPAKRQGWGND